MDAIFFSDFPNLIIMTYLGTGMYSVICTLIKVEVINLTFKWAIIYYFMHYANIQLTNNILKTSDADWGFYYSLFQFCAISQNVPNNLVTIQ